ncbi:hypothetical protein PIB30_004713 [Stylosanthes scabra]|uniref:Uncharacterized protein n=1 Tax=Stylosanthes scabra TaxID=79078 RepID=A0ABU6R481_9FABA|nr:hypothetical protein [Stylosanthes scabra]
MQLSQKDESGKINLEPKSATTNDTANAAAGINVEEGSDFQIPFEFGKNSSAIKSVHGEEISTLKIPAVTLIINADSVEGEWTTVTNKKKAKQALHEENGQPVKFNNNVKPKHKTNPIFVPKVFAKKSASSLAHITNASSSSNGPHISKTPNTLSKRKWARPNSLPSSPDAYGLVDVPLLDYIATCPSQKGPIAS